MLLVAKNVAIKISIKNLLIKKKQNFKEIKLHDFNANIDLKSLKKYVNIFTKKINFIPITFKKGKITFFDKKNNVVTINNADIDLIIQENSKEAKLKGKFLNDNIYINFSRKKINNRPTTDIILKISNLNLLTKANYTSSENDKDILNGDILIKKDKHRFVGIFDYKNNEIIINQSNLKNVFFNGQLCCDSDRHGPRHLGIWRCTQLLGMGGVVFDRSQLDFGQFGLYAQSLRISEPD